MLLQKPELNACSKSFEIHKCVFLQFRQRALRRLIHTSSQNPNRRMTALLFPPSSSFACVAHSSDDTIQTSRSSLRRSSLSCSSSRFSHILPLTSLNQSPLTKPYKNLRPRRDQTVECQRVPGAVFKKKGKEKKAGLCSNRAALFKRQLRGINGVDAWHGSAICSP